TPATTGAGAPAAAATAVATAPAPVSKGPEGHTQRLLTVVKAGSIQDVKATPPDKVHTWPHLLIGEFIACLPSPDFLLVFSALGIIGTLFRRPGFNFTFPWRDGVFFDL